jgi:hypothetical protein
MQITQQLNRKKIQLQHQLDVIQDQAETLVKHQSKTRETLEQHISDLQLAFKQEIEMRERLISDKYLLLQQVQSLKSIASQDLGQQNYIKDELLQGMVARFFSLPSCLI